MSSRSIIILYGGYISENDEFFHINMTDVLNYILKGTGNMTPPPFFIYIFFIFGLSPSPFISFNMWVEPPSNPTSIICMILFTKISLYYCILGEKKNLHTVQNNIPGSADLSLCSRRDRTADPGLLV